MEFITLNNGIDMPIVGFGTWDVRGNEGLTALKTAIDIGYRLFDTAEMPSVKAALIAANSSSPQNSADHTLTTTVQRKPLNRI